MQSHLLSMLAGLCTTAAVAAPSPSEPQQQSGHRGDHYRKTKKGREGGREGAREGGSEGGREGGREGGSEGGREGGRECGQSVPHCYQALFSLTSGYWNRKLGDRLRG